MRRHRCRGAFGETADDSALLAEAERVAGSADTIVMVIGPLAADESEGFDRTRMDLPANQLAALKAVAAVNPNVVVVLVNGSTVVLGEVTLWWSGRVSIELDQRAFAFWSVRHRDWAVEAGDFVIAWPTSAV